LRAALRALPHRVSARIPTERERPAVLVGAASVPSPYHRASCDREIQGGSPPSHQAAESTATRKTMRARSRHKLADCVLTFKRAGARDQWRPTRTAPTDEMGRPRGREGCEG
jgi:hypothetical protein